MHPGQAGQRSEGEAGLYWYTSRINDPALGRYIQPDSLIPDPGSSKRYDRYAYINNDPVNFNDPSGHKACDEEYGCRVENPNSKSSEVVNPPSLKRSLQDEVDDFNEPKDVEKDEMVTVGFLGITADLSPSEYSLLLNENGKFDFAKLYKMYKLRNDALNTAQSKFPNSQCWNDSCDAFRHAYWTAMLTKEFGGNFAIDFTTAHETEYAQFSIKEETFIDIHNNRIGYEIATKKSNASNAQIQNLVMNALSQGYLVIWNGQGIYYSNQIP